MRRLFQLIVEGNLDDMAPTGCEADPAALIVRRARTDKNDLTPVLMGLVSGLSQYVSVNDAEAIRIWSEPAT